MLESFRKRTFFPNAKGFPHEIFRQCKLKQIRESSYAAPTMHEFFRKQSVVETKNVPLQHFLAVRDENFSTENSVITL